MSFIPKNTSKITNTVLTDVGRKLLSEGNFNVKYFQVGDSEVTYAFSGITIENGSVLSPEFNAHNKTAYLGSNKSSVKYPIPMDEKSFYGLPVNVSNIISAFKHIYTRGFFEENSGVFTLNLNYGWVVNGNYTIKTTSLSGGTIIEPLSAFCASLIVEEDGCCPPETGETTTTTTTIFDPCDYTGTTETEECVLEDFSREVGEIKEGDFMTIAINCGESCDSLGSSENNLFTYKICCITQEGKFILDRELPDLQDMPETDARVIFYSSDFRRFYDSFTPEYYWLDKTLTFETSCDIPKHSTPVWNMNIPWSESPAGVMENKYKSFNEYGSYHYLGTKNYLGYGLLENDVKIKSSIASRTSNYGGSYFNSLGEIINVAPDDQKTIAIIHYSNNTIDFEYGEKLALGVGHGNVFKVTIPWLLWHNNTGNTIGETFYVDPPNYSGLNESFYFQRDEKSIETSTFYRLWDNNMSVSGKCNQVGRVFPYHKLIVFDDEEIVAAMSYKSNRNWTLPAPSIKALPMNTCNTASSTKPLITNEDWVWVTYLFKNNNKFTNSLHCNYYTTVKPKIDCVDTNMNIEMRFKNGFKHLSKSFVCTGGYYGERIVFLIQKTKENERPKPSEWRYIDLTEQVSPSTIFSGLLSEESMIETSFSISGDMYEKANIYDITEFISIPEKNSSSNCLNFGDEVYFYGNVETDIQSDVYEMKYLINLTERQFNKSLNPSWKEGQDVFLTEIGLFDEKDNLLLTSKLQSPKKREGIQQLSVSYII